MLCFPIVVFGNDKGVNIEIVENIINSVKSKKSYTKNDFTKTFKDIIIGNTFKINTCSTLKNKDKYHDGTELFRFKWLLLKFGFNDGEVVKGIKHDNTCIKTKLANEAILNEIWKEVINFPRDRKYNRGNEKQYTISSNKLVFQLKSKFLPKIKKSPHGHKVRKGFLKGGILFNDLYWSVGDKFNNSLRKEFQNPATVSFSKTAGEDSIVAIKIAGKINLIAKGEENVKPQNKRKWNPSFGYSVEKSSIKSNPVDIRGIYASMVRRSCRKTISVDIAKLDNFAKGNETIRTNFIYSPNIFNYTSKSKSDKCSSGYDPDLGRIWRNFSKLKKKSAVHFKRYPLRYFLRPHIGIEINKQQQQTDDPDVVSHDDSSYLLTSLNAGLEKGDFEFKYSIDRRVKFNEVNHLGYQEVSVKWFMDKSKHFSIGIKGSIGQRPIDTDDSERYELVFGYKR